MKTSLTLTAVAVTSLALAACGGDNGNDLPQLSPATGATSLPAPT